MDAMELKMGSFSELDVNEAIVVEGGNKVGQAIALTGGSVSVASGVVFAIVGTATFNPYAVIAGLGMIAKGTEIIGNNSW